MNFALNLKKCSPLLEQNWKREFVRFVVSTPRSVLNIEQVSLFGRIRASFSEIWKELDDLKKLCDLKDEMNKGAGKLSDCCFWTFSLVSLFRNVTPLRSGRNVLLHSKMSKACSPVFELEARLQASFNFTRRGASFSDDRKQLNDLWKFCDQTSDRCSFWIFSLG